MGFMNFDSELTLKLFEITLTGLKSEVAAVRSSSCNSIKDLCLFIYETMNKQTEKSARIQEAIGNLLLREPALF